MTSLSDAVTVGGDYVRIEPPRATQGELQLTNRLHMVRVDKDVLGVAEHLRRIDPHLVLWFDKQVEIFILQWEGFREKDGRHEWVEDLVGAYKVLDSRLIELVERIDKQGRGHYDLVRELDRLDEQTKRARDAAFSEKIGEASERLCHALRQDLGLAGSQAHMSGVGRKARAGRARRRRRGGS